MGRSSPCVMNITVLSMAMTGSLILGLLFLDIAAGQCFYTTSCSTIYDKGMSYRGPFNSTTTGRACVSWQHHVHGVTPERYPYDGLAGNYCRNPRGSRSGPWCYTSPENDGSKVWDYCPTPKCDPCLFRGVHMKEGDRFHHGCTLCFCQKTGIRCLECVIKPMGRSSPCVMNITVLSMAMTGSLILGLLFLDIAAGQCFYTTSCSTIYDKGMSYRGPFNSTTTGRACVSWQHHVHGVTPERYPYDGLAGNYCRNPRGSRSGPWCYTSPENDGSKVWDYCPTPKCDPCLFRGVHMKEGDRFHHGCTLCFCQKTGIRCLECSKSTMTDKMGCYMKTDWSASFPKCCPLEVCYGNKAFEFEEYFNYLRTYLPQRPYYVTNDTITSH